ncbi:hypothetical protein SRABI106_04146 [Rahnella aquatilis]|nr:hypothetical protein SRABI106_04146 [Rahnella aquatilis]
MVCYQCVDFPVVADPRKRAAAEFAGVSQQNFVLGGKQHLLFQPCVMLVTFTDTAFVADAVTGEKQFVDDELFQHLFSQHADKIFILRRVFAAQSDHPHVSFHRQRLNDVHRVGQHHQLNVRQLARQKPAAGTAVEQQAIAGIDQL